MKEEENTLIEKFLDGSLSEEEHKLFEQKISNSTEFEEEVKSQAETVSLLYAIGKTAIKEDVRQVYANYKKENVKKSSTKSISLYTPKWWIAAASVSIIVILSVIVLFLDFENPHKTTFDQYYRPYNGLVTKRNGASQLAPGMNLYVNKNYEQAIVYFLEVRPSIEKNIAEKLDLLIGNCYLNMGDYEKSLSSFNQVKEGSASSLDLDACNWYQALVYLKKGDITNSKMILEKIKTSESVYTLEAEKLLNEKVFSD